MAIVALSVTACGCLTPTDDVLTALRSGQLGAVKAQLALCPEVDSTDILAKMDIGQLPTAARPLILRYPGASACMAAAQEAYYAKTHANVGSLANSEAEGDALLKAGEPRRALSRYAAALSGDWSDDEISDRVRGRCAKLAATLDPLPPLPAEVRRRTIRGNELMREAKDEGGYEKAAKEFKSAVAAGPWSMATYYNLALAEEGAGRYADAIKDLKLYLLGKPMAEDARAVQDHIYRLEIKGETAE